MINFLQRLKCYFGYHDLIVSQDEQNLLDEAMKNPIAALCGLDRLSTGEKIVFKICTKCGAKR